MKIALLTLGTRGDVQPYAVLGRALQDRGHHVTLSTGVNFAPLAQEYNVNFLPVEADFQALINSDEGKAMMKNPFLARRHFTTTVQPMMIDAMKIFYELSKSSDCILFHVKSLADFFADQFPWKMMRANVIPAVQQTSEFPNPVFSAFSLPKFLNRFTYKLADLGLAMMNKAIREFRLNAQLPPDFPNGLQLPSIYGISPSFLRQPLDYPSNSYFTGFWHDSSTQELEPEIKQFVSSNKRTILVTFGSMPFETTFDMQNTLLALSQKLNIKMLVVKGWRFLDDSAFIGSDSIRVIANAPYDKLFPLVTGVVHHGGIGTIAECLRAGIPFLSCPVIYPMGDQFFWANRAYELGCSPTPVPLKKLTERTLYESLQKLISSEAMRYNTARISKLLKSENGIKNAVDIIENQFLPAM